jgi:chemotaxis protein CheD
LLNIQLPQLRLGRKLRLQITTNPNQPPAAMVCTQTESASVYITASQLEPKSALEEVRVDMAGMKVESKNVELVTSVGSCVAICLHDPVNKCGGMAHIMLPDSSIAPRELLPSKFADTAVPALIREIRRQGGGSFLQAKIAGGANMFPTIKASSMNIGAKNVEATKQILAAHNIRLLGEDVGGEKGRRVTLNVKSGVVTVVSFKGEEKKL